jgi:hypothetical protein
VEARRREECRHVSDAEARGELLHVDGDLVAMEGDAARQLPE